MYNIFSNIASLTVNLIASIGSSYFWWVILLVALGVIVLFGILFLLIFSIHLKRRKLKRETKDVKRKNYIYWKE
ncbi:MAG: hypothetical protein FWC11_01405 [Firmicutes bacterium]|nr:hypothetical protein [Bacillota bacterium]